MSQLALLPTPRSIEQDGPAAAALDDHDQWNNDHRGENPLQRADRAYAEILQEARLAQGGAQILVAFLLALAFTQRFDSINAFERLVYVLTLLLGAAAIGLLTAPAACHRMVYKHRLKKQLVVMANKFTIWGLGFLLLTIGSALLLVLDVVVGIGPATICSLTMTIGIGSGWFALPMHSRRRHRDLSA